MLPLLVVDRLVLPVVALTLVYLLLIRLIIALMSSGSRKTILSPIWDMLSLSTINDNKLIICLFYLSTFIGCGLLFVGLLFVSPPKSLPFLFPLLISAYCCVHFVLFFIYFNYQQLFGERTSTKIDSQQKQSMQTSKVTNVPIKKRV